MCCMQKLWENQLLGKTKGLAGKRLRFTGCDSKSLWRNISRAFLKKVLILSAR